MIEPVWVAIAAVLVLIVYLSVRLWMQEPETPPPRIVRAPFHGDVARSQLAQYDGRDSTKPILVGIDGELFDVTNSPAYCPGGSYQIFAGTDATRALALSSFETFDLAHPTKRDDFTQDHTESLQQWVSFFRGKYRVVGKILDR